jgi:transcription antitermination factor NusG
VAISDNQWIIIELNDAVEDVEYQDIEAAIFSTYGDGIEYFIPICHEKMGSYTSTSTLLEGYIFVRDCDQVRDNMINLKENRIFSKALSQSGKYQTISSTVIRGLKNRLKSSLKRKFAEGSRVRILEGVFKNLIGEVICIEDDGKKIMVRIKRISREIIAPIPATLLERVI